MAFARLNKQGVRSDEGFEFQFTGRFAAESRERDRVLEIYIEGISEKITIAGARAEVLTLTSQVLDDAEF